MRFLHASQCRNDSNYISLKMRQQGLRSQLQEASLLYKRFNDKACEIVVVRSLVTPNDMPPQ